MRNILYFISDVIISIRVKPGSSPSLSFSLSLSLNPSVYLSLYLSLIYIYIYTYIYIYIYILSHLAGVVEYADCFSAEDIPNECPGYDSETYDRDIIFLEFLGMSSSPSLPLLSDSVWPIVRVLSMGQIEIFNHLSYLKPFNCVQTN